MRIFAPDIPNIIANHPSVVRSLEWKPEEHPETDGFLLLDAQVADTENWVFLISNNGELCLFFEWSAPGVYQMHSLSLPTFRGKAMIKAAKVLVREMFVEHGADMLWGQTPLKNRAARMFNRLIGAKSCGYKNHFVAGDCELFRNSKARWLAEFGSE